MSSRTKALLGLLVFNGLSATGGGLALMTDWIPEQASWVRDTARLRGPAAAGAMTVAGSAR